MTPQEPRDVALELERLRGAVDTGFATINGRLDVTLTRTTQAEEAIAGLRADVEMLKRSRWPLPSLAALTGLTALGLTLYGIAGR
ncbi:hypothetical protein OG548_14460 [Streptomyces sp. NBC_01356]|uniref:hypothetical protein n=1 Tax=Streptomyces sp. NBC_01356 TaxID=2903836 RepID=UPI002E2EFFF0|nr:hypothetical protein [Streptomyces sp. NBC_01356]